MIEIAIHRWPDGQCWLPAGNRGMVKGVEGPDGWRELSETVPFEEYNPPPDAWWEVGPMADLAGGREGGYYEVWGLGTDGEVRSCGAHTDRAIAEEIARDWTAEQDGPAVGNGFRLYVVVAC